LLPLVRYLREHSAGNPRIAFNMAWVAESESKHHEIRSYGGNQLLMYEKLTEITRTVVGSLKEVDLISPAGTAIQNARTVMEKKLTRDDFHLSYDLGRYIAGLTFFCTLTQCSAESASWYPEGVGEKEGRIALQAVANSILRPYCITDLRENNWEGSGKKA